MNEIILQVYTHIYVCMSESTETFVYMRLEVRVLTVVSSLGTLHLSFSRHGLLLN